MSYFNIKPKTSPKWYQFRKWATRLLVRIAQKIDATSPDVYAFHMQQMMDMMIAGGSITRVDPVDWVCKKCGYDKIWTPSDDKCPGCKK